MSEERYNRYTSKQFAIENVTVLLRNTIISPSPDVQDFLSQKGSAQLKSGVSLFDLMKRQEISYIDLMDKFSLPELEPEFIEQMEIVIKYEGYINKQREQVLRAERLENKKLPLDLDYESIHGLSKEARQKLQHIRPETVGQASRISGVSPADISILLIVDEQRRRQHDK